MAGKSADNLDITLMEYDGFNQLKNVITGNTIAEYAYNPDGLRIEKSVNGVKVKHIWDGSQLVLEADNDGFVVAKYIRGINLILAEDGAGAKRYYLYNGHGDVIQLTDTSGNVIKNYDYDAFGNELNLDNTDTNPFRYCGEYFDKETGTYYLRTRYYDPATSRMLSEDTHWNPGNMIYGDNPVIIGTYEDALGLNVYTYAPDINAIKQSGNKYVYAMNNPILFIDPSGLKTVVFYYDNPGSGFKDQAMNSPYYDSGSDDVLMIAVTTADDFKREWNKLDDSDITKLLLYLHGGEGALYFKGSSIYFSGSKITFSDLQNKNVKGKVYLFSCHGGQGKEGNNVAWEFAQKTNSTVVANRGGVSYTKIFGKYYARTDGKMDGKFNITAIWGQYSYNKKGKAKYWPGAPLW